MDLAGRIEAAQTALGPDLAPQMNDVLDRLKTVPSGAFTIEELDVVQRWMKWQRESPNWFRRGSLWFGRKVDEERNILAALEMIAARVMA